MPKRQTRGGPNPPPPGPPVRRRCLPPRFLPPFFSEPQPQPDQLAGGGPEAPTLADFRLPRFHIQHHRHQHLLVHIDSCYPVSHRCLLVWKRWNTRHKTLRTVTRYHRSHPVGCRHTHRSKTRVPDQTQERSQLTQSDYGLLRSTPPQTIRFSSPLVGSDAHPTLRMTSSVLL